MMALEARLYANLQKLRDREAAKLPTAGAADDELLHGLSFGVAYELAVRITRGPHEAGVHDETECTRRVAEVLAMVGLEECSGMMPADLSGGQRKRIALARSIVLRPRVILYDEPTTGLDPIRSDVINELIIKLQQELEATSIVVTHDLTSAFKVADHMVLMLDGRIMLEGPPERFRDPEHPEVARFMQGRASEQELAAIRGSSKPVGAMS